MQPATTSMQCVTPWVSTRQDRTFRPSYTNKRILVCSDS